MSNITTCTSQMNFAPKSNNTSLFSRLTKGLANNVKIYLAKRHQQKLDRDAFRNLMKLDERSLKDIGISRDDVLWASTLAGHESASQELEKIRSQNVATERLQATRSTPMRKL